MTNLSRRGLAPAAAVAAVLALAACAPPGEAPDGPAAATTEVAPGIATQLPQEPGDRGGRLEVDDQSGPGDEVRVAAAALDRDARGFVVVYDDQDGDRDEILGYAPIPAAAAAPIVVELDQPLPAGSEVELHAVVHLDAEPVGEFQRGVDEPVAVDGDTLEASFTYTVES